MIALTYDFWDGVLVSGCIAGASCVLRGVLQKWSFEPRMLMIGAGIGICVATLVVSAIGITITKANSAPPTKPVLRCTPSTTIIDQTQALRVFT